MAQAQQNYLVSPFADEPRQARLLRIPGAELARGAFQWQGKEEPSDDQTAVIVRRTI